MANKPNIPDNMTIDEASNFWDEHDIFEFGNHKEIVVKFQLHKKHYVGISEELFKKIEKHARKNKIETELLIENWISERANQL